MEHGTTIDCYMFCAMCDMTLFHPLDNPSLSQVVWTHLDRYPVPRDKPDIVDPHSTRNMRQNYMSIIQLDLEGRAGQRFFDHTFQLD